MFEIKGMFIYKCVNVNISKLLFEFIKIMLFENILNILDKENGVMF